MAQALGPEDRRDSRRATPRMTAPSSPSNSAPMAIESLTAGWDHSARLWDAATGLPIGRPLRHQGVVNSATFSPDGQNVLTSSSDRTARLWNIASPVAAARPIQVDGAVDGSGDGHPRPKGLGRHRLRRGNSVRRRLGTIRTKPWQHGGSVCAVGLGHDGEIALTGNIDGRVMFWNVKTGVTVGQPLELGKRDHRVCIQPR